MTVSKKKRVLAGIAAALILPACGAYLYVFAARALRFLGVAGAIPNAGIAAAFAALCLLALAIKPIPIKLAAVTVLYFLVFGLIADFVNLILRRAAPELWLWGALYNSGALVLLVSAALLLYGFLHGKRVYEKRYRLVIPASLPNGRLRIAMLSDVHMGLSVDAEKLRRVCARIMAERPEVFFLVGDLCDDQTSPADMLAACELAGTVKPACGTFFVYGNHDLGGHGPALRYTPDAFRRALAEANVTILDDECAPAGACTVAGRRDDWLANTIGGRIPLKELLAGADPGMPVILLDHQPLDTEQAARYGVTLQLSGHTHAGQVWPASMIGWLLPMADAFYGHKLVGGCHVVVSSGLGCRGTTLRSGCNAEYVIIDLLSK